LEVGWADMLDHDLPIGLDVAELALVGVDRAIRADHAEDPVAAGLELKHLEAVGKAVWPPPPGEAFRVLDGGKHRSGRSGELPACAERGHRYSLTMALIKTLVA